MYTGQADDLGRKGHTSKVVLQLLEGKENNGHSLYRDNFYNSHGLAKNLVIKKGTNVTGTIQSNRLINPIDVAKQKLTKSETTCKYSEHHVMIGKWVDKRTVLYISTEFENILTDITNRRDRLVTKPLPTIEYNKYMSGIDRKDQMMSYYSCERKSICWYKKLFLH